MAGVGAAVAAVGVVLGQAVASVLRELAARVVAVRVGAHDAFTERRAGRVVQGDLGQLDGVGAGPAAETGFVASRVKVELERAEAGPDAAGAGHAVGRAGLHNAPRVADTVAREVNLELGVTVAAALEAESLEHVVTLGHRSRSHLIVAPEVTRCEPKACVDTHEATTPVVGVEAEGVGASRVDVEGRRDVEPADNSQG